MKRSNLKREDFKSEVDYLLALVRRHKKLCEGHLSVVWDYARFIRTFHNETSPPDNNYSSADIYLMLKKQYGEPNLN